MYVHTPLLWQERTTSTFLPTASCVAQQLKNKEVFRQKTLRSSVSCRGVGVHSGQPATITLHPGQEGSGYLFVRKDLKHNNRIYATWETVCDTMLSTTICNAAGVKVHTIEHVIAALSGLGVHNAILELDSSEVPIMDGSSQVFADMIQMAGLQTQTALQPTIRVLKPVQVTSGHATALLLPSDEPQLTMTFNAHGRLQQTYAFSYYPDSDDFMELLAQARTFGFYEDALMLQERGLAKGASLDNTVVLQRDGEVMNTHGLRFDDELIRHKILDALGDLALCGGRLIAHFEGANSGHDLNNKLLRALFQDPTAYALEGGAIDLPPLKQSLA